MRTIAATIWRELQHGGPRRESLTYAAPYAVFMAYATYSAWQNLDTTWATIFSVFEFAFLVVYLATWLLHDPAPRTRRMPRNLFISLCVLSVAAVIPMVIDAQSGVYNLLYVTAAVMILAPRNVIVPANGIILLIIVGVTVLLIAQDMPGRATAVLSSYTVTIALLWISRRSTERDIDVEITHKRVLHERMLAERERLASDLHDVLGQTLTAVSTMSQLSARLIALGRYDEAAENARTVNTLASDALKQMRAVVASRQILSIEEELTGAEVLLRSAGVDVTITGQQAGKEEKDRKKQTDKTNLTARKHQAQGYSPEVSDLIAHVIREGSSNIVHHSHARSCSITLEPSRVVIRNDGVSPRANAEKPNARVGSGLAGLQSRAQGLGEVTGRREGRDFVLELSIAPSAMKENTMSTADATVEE